MTTRRRMANNEFWAGRTALPLLFLTGKLLNGCAALL